MCKFMKLFSQPNIFICYSMWFLKHKREETFSCSSMYYNKKEKKKDKKMLRNGYSDKIYINVITHSL